MSDFDTMLWRPLRSGIEYDALIPVTSCKSTYVGNGNTDFSVDEMEKVIEQYAYQTEKIAQKLQRQTIKATTDNIHDFLFNHFQYMADESNQLLRSPACSWFTRKKGIDCKSYSILASCILLNLDVTHYIRRIKQPGYAPEEYTHVYVIVPKDQQTGSLESGYYVIDGTLKNNIEPAFVGKNDKKMSLRHYSLNGVPQHDLNGLGLSVGDFKLESLKDFSTILKSLDCIGGSAYSKGKIKKIHNSMETYFNNLIQKINKAVVDDNDIEFSEYVNEFYAITELGLIASQKKAKEGWNSCSLKGIKTVIKAWEFYKNNVGNAMQVWVSDGFVLKQGVPAKTFSFNSTDLSKLYGMGATATNIPITRSVVWYQPKGNPIKQFQISPYIAETNSTAANATAILQSLGNIIADYVPTKSNSGIKTLPTGGNYVRDLDQTKTTNAGMGWVIGGILTVVGLSFAFKNKNNKLTKE